MSLTFGSVMVNMPLRFIAVAEAAGKFAYCRTHRRQFFRLSN